MRDDGKKGGLDHGPDTALLAGLAAIEARARAMDASARDARERWRALADDAARRRLAALGRRVPARVEASPEGWPCGTAPIGVCCYAHGEGEECLFCGEPEERL